MLNFMHLPRIPSSSIPCDRTGLTKAGHNCVELKLCQFFYQPACTIFDCNHCLCRVLRLEEKIAKIKHRCWELSVITTLRVYLCFSWQWGKKKKTRIDCVAQGRCMVHSISAEGVVGYWPRRERSLLTKLWLQHGFCAVCIDSSALPANADIFPAERREAPAGNMSAFVG